MRSKSLTYLLRYSGLILGSWYLLVSLKIPFVVLDWVAPQTKAVVALDFPCATHDCGCKTAEQCRAHCCCFPNSQELAYAGDGKGQGHREGATVRVRYLSAVQCTTGTAKEVVAASPKLTPHLPIAFLADVVVAIPHCLALMHQPAPYHVFLDPPAKVPR